MLCFRFNSPSWVVVAFSFIALSAFAEIGPQSVTTLNGKSVTIGGAGDKPTLVFILATRCPVSNAYNDRMESIDTTYAERMTIVGVNPNETESNAEVASHAKENGLTFPIYRDPAFTLSDAWKVKVTPQAFLFDNSGKLYYSGRIDDNQEEAKVKSQDLRDSIERLLAGKPSINSESHPFGCSIKRLSK